VAMAVDASIVLAWHFDDEADETADEIARRCVSESVVVPAHWQAQVANGLLMGERRKRTAPDRISAFFGRLSALDVETDSLPEDAIFDRILPLARAHRLTIYDAIYLELAERRGVALATFDRELAEAARSVGVTVLGVKQ